VRFGSAVAAGQVLLGRCRPRPSRWPDSASVRGGARNIILWLFRAPLSAGKGTANLGTARAHIADITKPKSAPENGLSDGSARHAWPGLGGALAKTQRERSHGSRACLSLLGLQPRQPRGGAWRRRVAAGEIRAHTPARSHSIIEPAVRVRASGRCAAWPHFHRRRQLHELIRLHVFCATLRSTSRGRYVLPSRFVAGLFRGARSGPFERSTSHTMCAGTFCQSGRLRPRRWRERGTRPLLLAWRLWRSATADTAEHFAFISRRAPARHARRHCRQPPVVAAPWRTFGPGCGRFLMAEVVFARAPILRHRSEWSLRSADDGLRKRMRVR